MTATTTAPADLPVSDVDPFCHEVLEDPLPMHEQLREAGPVVYLSRYDTYAFARYDQVRSALVDWQDFQSAAGVGLSNFRYEKPWRPPSVLLEADPPKHDAPPAGSQQGARPAGVATLARAVASRCRGVGR